MKQNHPAYFRLGVYLVCTLCILGALTVLCALFDMRLLLPCLCAIALTVLCYLLFKLAASRKAARLIGEGEMTQSATMDFLTGFALPMLLLTDDGVILWNNDAFAALVESDAQALYNQNLSRFLPEQSLVSISAREAKDAPIVLALAGSEYALLPHAVLGTSGTGKSFLCVLLDLGEQRRLEAQLRDKNPIVAFVAVDNLSEDPTMSDSNYRSVLSGVAPLLESFAESLGGILREVGRQRYLLILEEARMHEVRAAKFDILDRVRALSEGNVEIPVTVSIGTAFMDGSFHEKEIAAYQALDTALQRGGDQAVVRERGGVIEYFGGRTKAVQRRTRIRSRVIAGEISAQMKKAQRVLIMGHRFADHDSIGACVGLARFAMEQHVAVNIVIHPSDPNLHTILEKLSGIPAYEGMFLDAAAAQDLAGPNTLLIIADVNNRLNFESPELYDNSPHVVIIDHHRKTDEFIVPPKITYIEPSASSACELVSEVLEQGIARGALLKEEAELLFAGILLDTKQFTRNTGTRTFAAALYLRDADADPAGAGRLFQTDLDTLFSELRFEKSVVIYRDVIAIAASDTKASHPDKIAASRAADRLLNLSGVQASFVLCMVEDTIHISARSAGKVNVQLILERLHGGGYFDAAGAQLKGFDFTSALELLKSSIDAYLNEDL